MELETHLQTRFRVDPVRVEVHGIERDASVGRHQLARVLIEDVGVSAHFVNGPTARAAALGREDGERRVMKEIEPADGGSSGFFPARVVDFLDLDGRDVAVFGQVRRRFPEYAEPIGRQCLQLDLG